MSKIHFNTAFEGLTESELEEWKNRNYKKLIGSAVFTKNNSLVSRVVAFFEKKSYRGSSMFIPSHVGTIIEYNNDLYLFNMRPMRASVIPLTKYILETSDDFVVMFRNFRLNTAMISANVADKIGDFYPFMSAIRSVFTKRKSKHNQHCSEIHLRQLQLQGLFTDVNPEITPLELYKLLVTSEIYK